MKIILINDVKGTGKKDEIKDVKDGYAKYLITNKLAVQYSNRSSEVLNKQIDKRNEEEQALISSCKDLANKLEKINLKFRVKIGSNGKVFGNISTKQISEELDKLGYKIDKKKISIDNELNVLGTSIVTINLHKKVSCKLNVTLESDK